ncbi:MAG TPA: glucoamylase family protein, partial [Bryobacteraceae bacterium]|nr:glucoamylase family protein [Bryobacteraceae bacterium]
PDISIPALRAMQERFGDRVFGRYGFVDGYNPTVNWFDTDVVGIDVGITMISAENLLTGDVWRWFMSNEEPVRALDLIGFSEPPGKAVPASDVQKPAPKKKPHGKHSEKAATTPPRAQA